jgi:lactate dehydrogenase-like 2-hydroxyacid dehydrogenase
LISNYGVGFNNIDVEYATQKGIVVTNIPNTTREPTAEMAFALLLGVARRISYYDRKMRSAEGLSWEYMLKQVCPYMAKHWVLLVWDASDSR